VHRNGLRATWNPPPVRVFTFGAYTVASHLSKLLHAKGHHA